MGRGASLRRGGRIDAGPTRRDALAATLALPWLAAGCTREAPPAPLPPVRWVGADPALGHRLRETARRAPSPEAKRADVVIVGAGIAGLSAARALAAAGVQHLAILELDAEPGGTSRGHAIGGIACPLGAHYLPVPGPHATEVAGLLDELGLMHGGMADERHLVHAPQERLWIDGAWHEGLLPPPDALPAAERARTLEQYRRFAALVAEAARGGAAFRVPTARAPWTPALAALDAQTFAHWLGTHGLDAPALRWLLDYACRDDYGADAGTVSAWAGLHYYASRHGFRAGDDGDAPDDAVYTWPDGNAHLVRRLAAPFAAGRLHMGRVVQRVAVGRDGVTIDAERIAANATPIGAVSGEAAAPERWHARAVVLAVPLFVAARLLDPAPDALRAAAAAMRPAPWLVANLHLDRPPVERPGIAAAWDSVRYGAADLGYVDAMHQSTRPHAGATVWTAYRAFGGAGDREARAQLLTEAPEAWARRVLDDLAPMHPDLPHRVTRIDLARHGHAMAVPRPGVRGDVANGALAALASIPGRVQFAHADLCGYSVFEEAMFQGTRAARAAAAAIG